MKMEESGYWMLDTGYWINEVFCRFYKWKKSESTPP